ncbi:MAG: hypothetical protein KDA55_00550 [Planctomycetales bacterium]|nr:hypothetical protein [Planctomycetales bacterium]
MSDAATQLIRAFSALSPSERYAVMLELAKISESETDLSDEDLARVGDELFGMYDEEEAELGNATEG